MDSQTPNPGSAWRRFVHSSVRSALLFGVLGLASWLMGVPFLWPSLGPTTYSLVFDEDKQQWFAKVFGAHAIGAVAGLITHTLLAPDLSVKAMAQPLGSTSFHIALSAIIALSLTTGLMRVTRWTHTPACATTLITALGLISGGLGVVYILIAVVIVYLMHLGAEQIFKWIGWV